MAITELNAFWKVFEQSSICLFFDFLKILLVQIQQCNTLPIWTTQKVLSSQKNCVDNSITSWVTLQWIGYYFQFFTFGDFHLKNWIAYKSPSFRPISIIQALSHFLWHFWPEKNKKSFEDFSDLHVFWGITRKFFKLE